VSSDYFAAVSDGEIAKRLMEKVECFYEFARSTNWLDRIRASYQAYNGLSNNGTGAVSWDVMRDGDQGELLQSIENHYRSFVDNLLTITTAQRPAIQCGAANSDYKSLAQTLVAGGLVDYYLTERHIETLLKRACKYGIYLSEGHVLVEWDVHGGDDAGPDMTMVEEQLAQGVDLQTALSGAQIQKEGDVKISVLDPLDVVRDIYAKSWDSMNWVITREHVNKFELAAQFPEHADRIVSLEQDEELAMRVSWTRRERDESDYVSLFKFYHLPSKALPEGKFVKFLADDLVLISGPMPYDELPVYPLFPDELDGTAFGDSKVFDLLGPQKVVNALDSSIVGNQLGRGIGNFLVPSTANIQIEAISSSMNEVRYDGTQKPEALEWPSTPAEFFRYKQEKVQVMETLSGINSVVRGSPNENVGADSSGAKLALIQAQAVQSNSGLQAAYSNLIRAVAMAIIKRFQAFGGEVPRVVRLAGKNNRYMSKEFTATDLADIDRVTVDVGNPLMRTVSGKMAIADKLVEMGVIKTADQYLMLVKAGTYEPLIEGEQSTQMRIREENENLMDGGQVPHVATIFDPHWLEIPQHLNVLNNPGARGTPGVVEAVTAAVQEHMDLFMSANPAIIAMAGGQAALGLWQQIQSMLAPPPMPMGPGGPPQPPPPNAGGEAPEVVQGAPIEAQQPNLPMNPATGERAEVPGVGDGGTPI